MSLTDCPRTVYHTTKLRYSTDRLLYTTALSALLPRSHGLILVSSSNSTASSTQLLLLLHDRS